MTYAAAKRKGAKDWFTGVSLSKDMVGSDHQIEVHHIFPKAILKREGVSRYDRDEIAKIAARIGMSLFGLKKKEVKRDREYICSEYAWECYNSVGIKIPYNRKGFVSPADFAEVDEVISFLLSSPAYPCAMMSANRMWPSLKPSSTLMKLTGIFRSANHCAAAWRSAKKWTKLQKSIWARSAVQL